jgi:gamma-butyrobetaine dioxygenase
VNTTTATPLFPDDSNMSAFRAFTTRIPRSLRRLPTTNKVRFLSTTKPWNSGRDNLLDDEFARQVAVDDPFPKEPLHVSSKQTNRFPDHGLPVMSLRDMCTCPRCVDPSTRQKLFVTAEIPSDIALESVREVPNGVEIRWANDIPGADPHISVFDKRIFNAMATTGSSKTLPPMPRRRLWNDAQFRTEVPDCTYEAYMEDDTVFYHALQKLHSHGLLFLKNVPESAESVIHITNRIGPLKNTFYGETWDVRSVPQAKNVAYTSQDLGFHMDLMYMKQPPHLQFLHCIRSSASGGASLFTDSFKAVNELFHSDQEAFCQLEKRPITFHYDHIDSHYYQHSRPLIELAPLDFGATRFPKFQDVRRSDDRLGRSWVRDAFKLHDYLEAVSWAPPFQAPFELTNKHQRPVSSTATKPHPIANMETSIRHWHGAAKKFNDIIHRKENIHERMMKPGECVIFDNRRVLHARKAFEVADAGKERWLRGAYLDKDPFMSKLRVLANRFSAANESVTMKDEEERVAAATAS